MGPTETQPRASPAPDHEVVIVGAGFGGMGAAIQLGRMGIGSILMVDQADDLGGTWHLNTYPGVAVDIASVTYSYSFAPNPHWSRQFAPGAELRAYAHDVADRYGLRRFMRFNTRVERAVYDEAASCWTVYLAGQPPVTGRILVVATGFLSQPKRPDIAGLDDFAGKVMHTAKWDHSYDLTGRTAAVIGTGATAVQLLPEIAPRLARLYVHQRTPIWVSPKRDRAIPPRLRALFARLPVAQRLARAANSTLLELMLVTGALHHRQLPFLARTTEQICRRHMERQIADPELRRKLTPAYTFGCKRPTFSNDYYPVFTRSHVELVTEPIARIEADAVVTGDGVRRAVDTLVLATGYKVWEPGNFPVFEIVGRSGIELGAWWREHHPQAYEGITVPGFPNLFNLPSPYAFTGLSYFFTIEAQMKHIARCLGEMRRRGGRSFEVTSEANDAYFREIKLRMGSSVFTNGHCAPANSYYFNQHGEASLLRPMSTLQALWRAGHFPLAHYRFG
ncbi:NAD(P)/FAD-dependent oxidoreductase [Enterovirga sp.]|uniref:flavin-containing monooxygenase n=1 Tax=Enterovirga sp. TaxID=2026350 RepID=UPI002608C3AD|nr:NAD(P)/FAD-dependent oxidoreductase [Enterovirga sp.]MDB5590803.1 NAD(P)/FAD-dependent oxidoreductase [Enterovirga sp.]